MSEEKPRTTEAQKRAKRKYMEKFVEIKVRMTPERRSAVQAHAEAQGESTTGFINRAIDMRLWSGIKPLLGSLVSPQRTEHEKAAPGAAYTKGGGGGVGPQFLTLQNTL